ncbi:MAG: hypothetical protein LUM44_23120 [Pyrinomonadaceae bacterium]|nr:hypothetical protein [Pyrinomonadaceae bacterium]
MEYKTDELLKSARLNENHSSVSAAEHNFADEGKASEAFSTVKQMLLSIGEWNEHALLSSFALFDRAGKETAGNDFSVGNFMRISLKGAMKYDWVRLAAIHEAENEFVLTVKPTFDPTAENRGEKVISHFFTGEAENNFCLVRKSHQVGIYVIGLHEKMNSTETDNSLETIRNAAVNLGSYLGIQTSEWEKFCHHLLDDAAEKGNI